MDVEGAECQYNLGEMGGAHAMAWAWGPFKLPEQW